MRLRLGLWLTGFAAVALFVALSVLDGRLHETGGPGIIPFELAGELARAREILADWGAAGRDTARLSLWLDFAFLVAYGGFLALAATAARDMALRRGWRRLAAARGLVVALPVGAAALDVLENNLPAGHRRSARRRDVAQTGSHLRDGQVRAGDCDARLHTRGARPRCDVSKSLSVSPCGTSGRGRAIRAGAPLARHSASTPGFA